MVNPATAPSRTVWAVDTNGPPTITELRQLGAPKFRSGRYAVNDPSRKPQAGHRQRPEQAPALAATRRVAAHVKAVGSRSPNDVRAGYLPKRLPCGVGGAHPG